MIYNPHTSNKTSIPDNLKTKDSFFAKRHDQTNNKQNTSIKIMSPAFTP
jgi:hypothetical protein